MHKQLIEKPLIIAIIGKSCTGKDTLANFLADYFTSFGLYAHTMVSTTTRPPRVNEKDGKNYYFVDDKEFVKKINNKELIEYTHFRDWWYGVTYDEVKFGYINIGIFNVEGLKSLQKSKYDYTIIPVYLEEKLNVRLRRSHDRENAWRLEYFRRVFADWKDFKNIDKELVRFHGRRIYLRRENGVWRQAKNIVYWLEKWNILKRDRETNEIKLGNFI